MTTRDKAIRITAEKLGLSITQVEEVVKSQAAVGYNAIRKQEPLTVYLRNLGSLISMPVRVFLSEQRVETIKNRVKPIEEVEEPYEFN